MFHMISLAIVLQALAAPFAFTRIWLVMQMTMAAGVVLAILRRNFPKQAPPSILRGGMIVVATAPMIDPPATRAA